METKNIIQASANVIKLVNLKKGDVFKSIKVDTYDSGISFNIVTELYNDGENTFIEVVQYEKSYEDVKSSLKVFKGTDDLSIFPATVKEVGEYFGDALKGIASKIEEDKEQLQSKIVSYEKATKFVDGELSKQIQEAEFKEQTQEEFNSDKALKEVKIKELQD